MSTAKTIIRGKVSIDDILIAEDIKDTFFTFFIFPVDEFELNLEDSVTFSQVDLEVCLMGLGYDLKDFKGSQLIQDQVINMLIKQ